MKRLFILILCFVSLSSHAYWDGLLEEREDLVVQTPAGPLEFTRSFSFSGMNYPFFYQKVRYDEDVRLRRMRNLNLSALNDRGWLRGGLEPITFSKQTRIPYSGELYVSDRDLIFYDRDLSGASRPIRTCTSGNRGPSLSGCNNGPREWPLKTDDSTVPDYVLVRPSGLWIEYRRKDALLHAPALPYKLGFGNQVVATYIYNENNNITSIRGVDGTDYFSFTYQEPNRIPSSNSVVKDFLLKTVKDYKGREVKYFYNEHDLLSEVVDVNGQSWFYNYKEVIVHGSHKAQQLESETGPNGYFKEFYYEELGRGVRHEGYKTAAGEEKRYLHTWTNNRKLDLTIDHGGAVSSKRYEGRALTQYSIDGENVFSRTFPTTSDIKKAHETGFYTEKMRTKFGTTETRYSMTPRDRVAEIVFPDGSITKYERDLSYPDRVTAVITDSATTRFEYDSFGFKTKVIEAAGLPEERVTEFVYDDLGNRTEVRYIGDANTQTAIWKYEYDTFGNMTKEIDPEGSVTEYKEYDAEGNPWLIVDARGKEWRYEYDAKGNRTKSSSPKGETTQYFYDERGEYYRRLDPNTAETQYTLDADGYTLKETDALGQFIEYEYDAGHRVTKFKVQGDEQGAAKKEWQYVYNSAGKLAQEIQPLGEITQYNYSNLDLESVDYPTFKETIGYDKIGRITGSTRSGENFAQQRRKNNYDASHNLISETDAEGKTYTYDYDALGRMISATDPQNGTTYYQWDNRDNLIKITDPEGRYFDFEYDRSDQLVKETRHLGQTREYRYYADGLLETLIDAKGQISQFEYDDAGNLTKTQHFVDATAQTNVQPQKVIDYTYNNLSLLTSYNDGTTNASYVYDLLGQLKEVVVDYGAFSLTHKYDYYPSGLRKSYTSPEGVTYTYIYNANNDLVAVKIPGEGNIIYSNHKWHAPTTVTYPGGSQQHYEYDGLLRRLDMILLDPAQNQLAQYDYTYDRENNLKSIAGSEGNYQQTYDELYRVTTAQLPDPENTKDQTNTLTQNYQYDGIGNRISQDGISYQYNENNQLISQDDGTTRIDYQYDANGSLIQKTLTNDANPDGKHTYYDYDAAGSMEAIRDHAGLTVATYYYDPFGRRLWKETGGQRTYFHYNADGLTGEYTYSGGQLNPIAEYGFTPDGYWMTDPLFTRQNGQVYYYQNDHRGTPTRIIAKSGEVVWQAQYDTFGLFYPNKTEIHNPIRMPGQYHDEESGLYYNYARYYDPTIGRYITEDPLGIAGDGPNVYTYALNNPHTLIDPLGKCALAGAILGGLGNLAGSAASGCFDLGDFLIDTAAGGLCNPALAAARAARKAKRARDALERKRKREQRNREKNKKQCGCFEAGTQVATKDGSKSIESIEKGDLVLAKNIETGEIAYREVKDTYIHDNSPIYEVEVMNQQGEAQLLHATGEHPFWVKEHGWLEVENLIPGLTVENRDEEELTIIDVKFLNRLNRTYNFNVDEFHTYYVGEEGVLVHNQGDGPPCDITKRKKKGAANPKVKEAARRGREAHKEFAEKVKDKGWQSEPRLVDPKTGKTVIPDAVTKSGRPVELKPNTKSGRRQGRRQIKKYERATGKKGRVVYYNP